MYCLGASDYSLDSALLTSQDVPQSLGIMCQNCSSFCCTVELLCKRNAKGTQNLYSSQNNCLECFSPLLSIELHTLFSTSVLSNNSGRNRILESLTTLSPHRRLLVIENRIKFSLAYFVPDSNQTFCSCISQWPEKIKTLLGSKSFLVQVFSGSH